MSQQQLRTIYVNPTDYVNPTESDDGMVPASEADVLIVALGMTRRTRPGRSMRETLAAEGIAPPTTQQTLRVNNEQLHDLTRTLRPGDRLTIVHKVVGGGF
jgi:hypothetical protein